MNQKSQNVCNFVKRRKANLVKVFHSKCCICGFNKYQSALEFHHVNPEEKEFGITQGTTTKALEKQLKEMKKCILVCANCHRGIHEGLVEIPKNYKDFYDIGVANQLIEERDKIITHQDNYCQRCGKTISKKAKFCVECSHLSQRSVNRPSRDELKILIRTIPFTQIANKFGVTDNAVRKWCDSMNLPRKKKDIVDISDEEWQKI